MVALRGGVEPNWLLKAVIGKDPSFLDITEHDTLGKIKWGQRVHITQPIGTDCSDWFVTKHQCVSCHGLSRLKVHALSESTQQIVSLASYCSYFPIKHYSIIMYAGKIIWRPACCLLMFFPSSIIHLLALLNAGHVSVLVLTISYIWHLSAVAYGNSDLWYNSSSEQGPNFKKGFSCKRCTNGVCILHSCSILTCCTSNLSERTSNFETSWRINFFFPKSLVTFLS